MLLMGEGALTYLEGAGAGEHGTWQMPGGATGIPLPSLQEMLQNPLLKKQVWQAIRHLAAGD